MTDEELSEREREIRDVYAHYGRAMYMAQVFEHGLVNALVVASLIPRHSSNSPATAEAWVRLLSEFMDSRFERTAGKLLREIESLPISEDLTAQLREAVRLRNWLVHDYYRERSVEMLSVRGRKSMIAELDQARQSFRDADDALDGHVRPQRLEYGMTDEVLEAEFRRLVAEHGD